MCELLQLLVGGIGALSPHHRLDRLGQHLPALVKVLLQTQRVDCHLGEAREERCVGDHGVGHAHTDVAHDGGVGEVTLEARGGQLGGEVGEECVREAQVAFAVLEVDGVHLVRHCGRADLPWVITRREGGGRPGRKKN